MKRRNRALAAIFVVVAIVFAQLAVSAHACGTLTQAARAHVETMFLPGDGAEQDPEVVWAAVKTACGAALRYSGVSAGEVLAVICTSQYSSIVAVDERGHATMNMVLWMDKRGATPRLRKLAGFPRGTDTPLQLLAWLRVHGLPPVDGGMSMTHMRWIKYARPEVYGRAAKFLEPVALVQRELSRLSHLVGDFLRFARPADLYLRRLDSNHLIEHATSQAYRRTSVAGLAVRALAPALAELTGVFVRHDGAGADSPGEGVAELPVGGGDVVVGPEVRDRPNRHRFLPDVEVAEPADLAETGLSSARS